MKEIFVKDKDYASVLAMPKMLDMICEQQIAVIKVQKQEKKAISKVLCDLLKIRHLFISDKHHEEWFLNAIELLAHRNGIVEGEKWLND